MSVPGPPGQPEIAYRAGTHATFRTAMLDALGSRPALAGLRTRDADDPIVAACDAWAAALDVLTFLTERTANEGFLRTATERRSLVHLARTIGYELRPGVAADTHLAFTVLASPGAPASFPIPVGTRAQSVPGPGELPQSFETVEPIADARPEWSSQPIRAAEPRLPRGGDLFLRLARTDLGLVPGDVVLVVAPDWFDVRRVLEVDVVGDVVASDTDLRVIVAAHTKVTLDAAIVERAADFDDVSTVEVHHLRLRSAIFGHNAPDWRELPLSLRIGEIHPGLLDLPNVAFRTMAATSGPSLGSDLVDDAIGPLASAQFLTEAQGFIVGPYVNRQPTWADAPFPAGTDVVHLDAAQPSIVAGSWAVLERSDAVAARRITAVAELPHREFAMSAKVTRLTLHDEVAGFGPRTTTVLAASRRLALAPAPLPLGIGRTGDGDSIDTVELAFPFGPTEQPLAAGRTVVLSGLDLDDQPIGEVGEIHSVLPPAGAGPRLRLVAPLANRYRRTSLRLLANAARATHGESRAEVLGSGDHRIPFPSFTVRQQPLTHTRAPTPSGTASTLAIWVQGVRWTEVASLHDQGPTDRVYVARPTDDGGVRVTFGDGRTGARLPTGRDNVVATLRTGIGTEADLGIGRITIPLSRPLGLRDVTNPVAASGADDPETIEAARTNAPLPVRTIGRIVSLSDHADFARAYAGVAKARSDLVWDGERNLVVLTLAGADGAEVDPVGPLATSLIASIDGARHASTAIVVAGFERVEIAVQARLVTAPDRRFVDVAAAATRALVARFRFARQDFATPVPASAVLQVLHATPGVVGVLLDAFHPTSAPPGRAEVVAAWPARRVGSAILPAQIAVVADDGAAIQFAQEVVS